MLKPLSPKTLEKKYAELGLSKAKTELLHTYFRCFANLYGVISLCDAWEVFKRYEGTAVRRKDFLAFSGIVQREAGHPYSVFELKEIFPEEESDSPLERMIVNNKLLLSGYYRFRYVYALDEEQWYKPYCLPEKQILLSYTEDRFYMTPCGKKMKAFVEGLKSSGVSKGYARLKDKNLYDLSGKPVKGKRLSEFVFFTPSEQCDIEHFKSEAKKKKLRAEYSMKASEKLLNRIELGIMTGSLVRVGSIGEELEYLIDYMEADFGVALSEKQFEKFAELYTVLNNNSSLWVNSGWSPEALYRETGVGAPKAISVGPNMRKMFASGELDEEDFKKYLAEMGIELI